MTQPKNDQAAEWNRVREVFFAALDVEDAQRNSFVTRTCGNDAALAREVLRLLELDQAAGAFMERPAISALAPFIAPSDPVVLQGDRLADRYRLLEVIGRGGMGEVWEAHDEVINDVVAVKIVHTDLEPIESLAARWRREVLLARRVSHRGVCRVHDVAIHRGDGRELLLLTMERLRGESLGAHLRRGVVPLDEALAIAGQIAEALAAAHHHGVLHRDVKPDNIFIEPRDHGVRAVLTDFGLARDVAVSEAVSHPGTLAGTPGYLAPELLRGRPPSVQSDVYAFAVVVRTLIDSSMSELPSRLKPVFSRALNPEPELRFESTLAFVEALTDALKPATPSAGRRPANRRVALLVAAGIVVVALLSSLFRIYRTGTATIAPASQVLLTNMTNGTNERELDGIGEVLRSQLAQSTHFELLDASRVQAALAQMGRVDEDPTTPETAREIALREGVPLVVYAALRGAGAYAVDLKLEQVGPRPTFARRTWTRSFSTTSKEGLFESLHEAAGWIRVMAGEVPSELEDQDRAASETTTSSWEALRLFSQANALSAAGRLNEATLVLEQAIRVDPEFAMAQTRLGDHLISLRRDKEGYAAWQRAIALAERRQLTSRETLRIRGQYFDDTGDLAAAEKAYRTYTIHYPNDFHAAFFLGHTLIDLNRTAEAVPWLEKAFALRPTYLSGAVHLATAYLDTGRSADFERTLAHVQSLDTGWHTWLRALATFTTGEVQQAMAALTPLQTSADQLWRSRASTLRASWLSEMDREGEAMAELRRGIEADASQGLRDRQADKLLHLATLELRRGHRREAVANAQHAIDVASNATRLVTAIRILAAASVVMDASRMVGRFDDLPQVAATVSARHLAQGELALAKKDVQAAIKAFESGFINIRRRDSRLSFARALMAAGDAGRAERHLAVMVDHPVAIYSGPEPQGPGLWRQAIKEQAAVIERRDPRGAETMRQRFPQLFESSRSSTP